MLIPVCLLGAYIVLLLAPAIVLYGIIFSRRTPADFPDRDLRRSPLGKKKAQLSEEFAFFGTLSPQQIRITASDGTVLQADLYDGGHARTAVCFHGCNSTPLNCFSTLGRRLYADGWNLLLVTQRAHGKSGGKHCGLGILEQQDVLCWADWACARPGTRTVVLAGVSMGCTSVALCADRLPRKVRALILDCGYTSPCRQLTAECRRRHLPAWALMPVIRALAALRPGIDLRQSTLQPLAACRIPVFFVHGTADRTVDVAETEENYRACGAPGELRLVPGAPHAGAFAFGGEALWDALRSFLSRYCP